MRRCHCPNQSFDGKRPARPPPRYLLLVVRIYAIGLDRPGFRSQPGVHSESCSDVMDTPQRISGDAGGLEPTDDAIVPNNALHATRVPPPFL